MDTQQRHLGAPDRQGADGKSLAELAREVAEHPNEVFSGNLAALDQLAGQGGPAVAAVLAEMQGACPPGQHSRDVMEALGYALKRIARRDPQPVLDVISRDEVPPDPVLTFLVFALEDAPRIQVVPTLCMAATHKSDFVRWAAVSVLARFGTKDTVTTITAALRDRSHMVKAEAVEVLSRKKRLRSPEAIEPLRRIIANSIICKHSPGLWDQAHGLLKELEAAQRPEVATESLE